ncbi:MAG: rhomboid family intramembrane serine protease [Waterburya sp.]
MSDLRFRPSLWVSIWITITPNLYFFVLTPFLVMWLASFGNFKYSVMFVSAIFLFIFLISFICFSIYGVYAFQITVNKTGIYGYNILSNGSFVAWDEIDKIEPYSFFGCRYLRLFFYNSTVPLWIPLFLVNQKQFNQTVIEYSPQNNPLHIALLNIDELFYKIPFHGKAKNRLEIKQKQQQNKSKNYLKLSSIFQTENKTISPWMEQSIFSIPPEANTYGYCTGNQLFTCSRSSLIENIKSDSKKLINLVWTPETSNLVSPEEVPWLIDSLYTREKTHLKQKFSGNLINCLFWGIIFLANFNESAAIRQITLFNWIAIAIIPAIEDSWKLYQSRIKTPQRLAENSQENRYTAWIKNSDAPWTRLLTGCISIVAIVQAIVFFLPKINSSIETAGIIKSAVWQGEPWRILTGTLLHGNPIHFMFNITALFILSKLIEVITHRAYVPLVFLITALCGSVFSLLLIPNTSSVGVSGGIMGLLGFLFILGRKHKHFFPANHQQMLIKATIYTFLAGLLAHQVIDNPAHLGGFLGGIFLGEKLVSHQNFTIPMKQVSRSIEIMGIISGGIILIATLFTIYKMIII